MICPRCGGRLDIVETRHPDPLVVRRRRKCRNCGFHFTTYEPAPDNVRKMNERDK